MKRNDNGQLDFKYVLILCLCALTLILILQIAHG